MSGVDVAAIADGGSPEALGALAATVAGGRSVVDMICSKRVKSETCYETCEGAIQRFEKQTHTKSEKGTHHFYTRIYRGRRADANMPGDLGQRWLPKSVLSAILARP